MTLRALADRSVRLTEYLGQNISFFLKAKYLVGEDFLRLLTIQ